MRILNLFWDDFENIIEIEGDTNMPEDNTCFFSRLVEAENDKDLFKEESLKELLDESNKINDEIESIGEILIEKFDVLIRIEKLIRKKIIK